MGENASREECKQKCKQTKENAGSYEATAARYVARMSPGRLNGRNIISDVLLLKKVHGT